MSNEGNGNNRSEMEQELLERLEEAKTELETVRETLKAANKESASRRHRISELEEQLEELTGKGKSEVDKANDHVAELEKTLAAANTRLRKYDLRDAFEEAASKLEIAWSGAKAASDAFQLALPTLEQLEIGDTGEVKAADVKAIVEKTIDGREYLLASKKEAPDIDAKKRSDQKPTLSEQELAAKKRESLDYTNL